ncbi:MAG: RluA family pseudouridine synthase [Nevskia sp.]|nr:RluA family pseudouridine synthase [Nevskia sp.]
MTRPTRQPAGFKGSSKAPAGKGRGAAPSTPSKARPPRQEGAAKGGPRQERGARPAKSAPGDGHFARSKDRASSAPKGASRPGTERRDDARTAGRARPGSHPGSEGRSRTVAKGEAPAHGRNPRPAKAPPAAGHFARPERSSHAPKSAGRTGAGRRDDAESTSRTRPGAGSARPRPAAKGSAFGQERGARPARGPVGERFVRTERLIRVPKVLNSGSGRGDARDRNAEGGDGAEAVASDVRKVTVSVNEAGQRIDNFLLKRLPGVPKSHVYRLLRSGQVRVGGGRAKAERKLEEGEEVRIPPVRVAERGTPVRAPDAVLNRLREAIVYEDHHYLAISKPAGLASHGGTGIAYGVIEAARGWDKYEFLELAHRLDRDTSGVLLLAKSRPALLRAQRAFRDGLANKRYFALLIGRLQGGARDVDAALVKSRLEGGERFIAIDEEDGKPSRSRFVPQAHYRDATLCEVEIFSGRTHQIRVHALALGHPVAGDRKYGLRDEQKPLRDLGLRRMFLHSHFLELPADGEFRKLTLSAPMTGELRDFLDELGPGK